VLTALLVLVFCFSMWSFNKWGKTLKTFISHFLNSFSNPRHRRPEVLQLTICVCMRACVCACDKVSYSVCNRCLTHSLCFFFLYFIFLHNEIKRAKSPPPTKPHACKTHYNSDVTQSGC
jgi:hypothetical protein